MLRRNIPRTNLRNFENKIGPQKTGVFFSEIWQNLPSSKHNTEWGRIFPFTTGRGPPCTFFPLNHDGRKSKIHDGRYEFLWKSLKSRQITSIQHLSLDFCPSAVAKKNNVNKKNNIFFKWWLEFCQLTVIFCVVRCRNKSWDFFFEIS